METVDTDVLVVGAGGAGIRAALEADGLGADVTLVDKSIIGKGGATVMALCQICASLGLADDDDWHAHFEDTIRAGKLVNNQELVEVMAREAPERLLELEKYGVQFDRLEDGTLRQIRGPGHSKKRASFVDLHTGQAIIAALLRELNRHPRLRKLNNLLVTRLIVEAGRITGAVGLDLVRGLVIAFRSPTVILTTGGGSWLWPRSTGGPNLTGDGYSLAFRAGAELVDMEFPQFNATITLHPKLAGINIGLSGPVRYRTGGTLRNSLGEEFLTRYTGSEEMSTRDAQSYAVTMEVRAGRGGPHGGVFSDLSTPGPEVLEREYGPFLKMVRAAGLDLRHQTLEVGVHAHFFMGGVRINGRCESTVTGLYAAGECAGGLHGANRITGNALAELLVFGARAGRYATEYARAASRMGPGASLLEAEEERVQRRRRHLPDGVQPLALRRQLGQLLWDHLGPIRNADGLRTLLEKIGWMRERELPRLSLADSSRIYNLEWVEALETEMMLDVAEMIAHAAYVRTESRGAHFREDYPKSQPAWLKNIVIKEQNRRMSHRIEPLVVTSFPVEAEA